MTMTLASELKRRNIFRVAVLYITSGWVINQVTVILAQASGLEWVHRFVFAMLLICFPLALLFSWIYEITPEGLRKERDVRREESIAAQTGQKLNRLIYVTLVLAILLALARSLLF